MSKEKFGLKSEEEIAKDNLIEQIKEENENLKENQTLMQKALDDLLLGGTL